MKKIALFLLLILIFSSCVTQKATYRITSQVIDYSHYYLQGFFITESPSVSFNYTPIGSIGVVASSGYEIIEMVNKTTGSVVREYGAIKNVTIYDALDELQKKCKEIGANGVVNLRIEYEEVPIESLTSYDYNSRSSTSYSSIVGARYIVWGMAISR